MGLNLNSLKNLAPTLDTPEIGSTTTVAIPTMSVQHTEDIATTTSTKESVVPPAVTPATGPKISLMKLKKASGIDAPVIQNKEEKVEEGKSVAQIEKELQAKAEGVVVNTEETPVEVVNSTIETVVIQSEASVPEKIADSSESQSIIIGMDDDSNASQEEVVTVVEEAKEFFPKFNLGNSMKIDEDLVDLNDLITIKEDGTAEIATKPEIEAIPLAETITETIVTGAEAPIEITPIESISTTEEAVAIEIAEETINTQIPTEESSIMEDTTTQEEAPIEITPISEVAEENTTPTITPEYVAEVKTELSEQRRGGFRFFAQQKTKIMAGMGIVLSISAIAFFSTSLLPTGVDKAGKTNIHEVTPPVSEDTIPTPTTDTVPPPVENPDVTTVPSTPPDYEIGKDYSVTKNTKKNIRSKALPDTASGTEVPTP